VPPLIERVLGFVRVSLQYTVQEVPFGIFAVVTVIVLVNGPVLLAGFGVNTHVGVAGGFTVINGPSGHVKVEL
jgi:hypothetical protein